MTGAPTLHTPTPRPAQPPVNWGSSLLAPLAAGLATVCASTSLTGVVGGWAWLGYVIVAVVLVSCTGLALRSVRTPTAVVGLAQVAVLAFLITGVFTGSGIAAIIPGPAAIAELGDVLAASFEQIRTGLPPVDSSPPILCLVTIAIGLVAILVDTLAVAAAAPAATGLILLCVYAVPASLSDSMLPWWTFALGAAAFAGLLAVDGSHRHRSWRNRDAPGLGGSPRAAVTPVAVVAVALVVGLGAGSAVTAIGTVGRLPGAGVGGQGPVNGGLGVNPFTSMRGMLDQGPNVELFRVRGMNNDKRLLRAFTLDTYRPNQGWGLPDGAMPAGVPAEGVLPPAPGDDGESDTRVIEIEPINWVDVWLPVYGDPRRLRNLAPGWFYDRDSAAVFRERRQKPAPYVEEASLAEPSKSELRAADSRADEVSPSYTSTAGIDPRVADLAGDLTAGENTTFDKATALWEFFTEPENGFTYDTQTAAAADSDALADFVLNGKRGFCEQFASAMAVMLRSQGIPSRVAIGFTTGYTTADYRSITSQDAHAWVEVYFGDQGWVPFDPTPLADGRGYLPSYLQADDAGSDSPEDTGENAAETPSTSAAASGPEDEQDPLAGAPGAEQSNFQQAPAWSGWGALLTALAALILTAATVFLGRRASVLGRGTGAVPRWLPPSVAALWLVSVVLAGWQFHWIFALGLLVVAGLALLPSGVRELQRRRRLRTIASGHGTAANAAWAELLDECADRGISIPRSDTVRAAAQKVASRHHLDEEGRDDLRTVVGVVERSWYSPAAPEDPNFAKAFNDLRESLRRTAPMSWRGRLLPRSLLRRRP
ncbi:Transglutaminase-like enzyme, putative cysteine protease [Amycolatopsis marina]|uniref:Transglutaminase-like enzyme, putative cysteine protease n=1 Tax=Amycolatopsis marina TaxID=490629 RepID=A0A1I1B972_9PSEU|nr:transglutaminaseTgpA domain-containing protein [Amycolatopsis marina]SFB46647.1 Transglutaminase-like enzyme, putative cysteine protease [Amycolatopsis marina]